MEVVWLGGRINEELAAYLRTKGVIDDFEANEAYVRLIINRDSVTIDRMGIQRVVESITGKKLEYGEFSKIWLGMWHNIYGGRVVKIDESSVTLARVEERVILSVRVPEGLKEKLEEIARDRRTTLTDVVIEALNEFVSKEEK